MSTTITTDLLIDQQAWDLAVYYSLREEFYYDQLADVKSTNTSHNGSSVNFTIMNELTAQTVALNESTDITPESMGDSQVNVPLEEYGNAVRTTKLLRGTSFVPLNPIVAELIGFNAGDSLDTIAKIVAQAGSNVLYSSAGTTAPPGRTSIEPEDIINSNRIRQVYANLRTAKVAKLGGFYASIIHPDVAYDLRRETGAAAWRDPHVYSQPGEIWMGEIGEYEGFRFIVSPRAPLFADAGSSTTLTDVYGTLFMGRQAIAKAWSKTDGNGQYPTVVPGPVTDVLRRFVPLGWHWLGGYDRFREASLRRVETSSSIGTN
jgi:N4-gp56 family major capsid protein